MWEHIKEITSDVFGWSALAWVLTHLILIKIHGTFYIYESNGWILWFEIAFTSGALLLQSERFVKHCIKMKQEAKINSKSRRGL